MSEESNRSPDNLIPLCEEHAFEIDATPEHFPAELLLEWKRAQLEEHLQLGKSWPLSDAEAAEVAVESFDYHSIGRATAGAHIVLSVARQVGLLIETGRLERRVPERAAQAWRELREQVNRSMPVFDAHGERLVVEPSIVETEPRRVALEEALAQAVVRLEPIAAQAVAELHAVIAAEQRLAPWCSWVERAIREVLTAAGHWPGRPPLEDDDVWPNSLAELSRASQALMARWRGEKAPEPPAPTPPETPPAETAEQGAVRQHEELLERARPWARVDHRAYDADLCRELMDAAAGVVLLPDIPSLLATGLDATARLAARVARNSDDRTFDELIDQAAARQPLAVAVTLLRNMMFVARDAGRPELESKAAARAGEILAVQTWREVDVWTANRTHARTLLAWTAAITSDEAVRTKLASAVEQHPEILPSALLAMAQWIEERDVRAFSHVVGIHFQIEDLPAWFATEAFATAIRRSLPNVNAADEDDSARYSDDVDRLASQVLWLADNATENCGG